MQKTFLTTVAASIVSVAVLSAAAPVMAQTADPACRRANNQATTNDTLIGGAAGALLGVAVAGKHKKLEGAAIGGLGGALIGNVVGQNNSEPCPPGYVRVVAPPPPPPEYNQGYRPPPPAYRPPPPPAYRPPPPPPGDFWYGAPESVHERIEYLQRQIGQANRDGYLSPRELRRLSEWTEGLRRQEGEMLDRNGGVLYDADLRDLYHHLSDIGRRLQHDLQDTW